MGEEDYFTRFSHEYLRDNVTYRRAFYDASPLQNPIQERRQGWDNRLDKDPKLQPSNDTLQRLLRRSLQKRGFDEDYSAASARFNEEIKRSNRQRREELYLWQMQHEYEQRVLSIRNLLGAVEQEELSKRRAIFRSYLKSREPLLGTGNQLRLERMLDDEYRQRRDILRDGLIFLHRLKKREGYRRSELEAVLQLSAHIQPTLPRQTRQASFQAENPAPAQQSQEVLTIAASISVGRPPCAPRPGLSVRFSPDEEVPRSSTDEVSGPLSAAMVGTAECDDDPSSSTSTPRNLETTFTDSERSGPIGGQSNNVVADSIILSPAQSMKQTTSSQNESSNFFLESGGIDPAQETSAHPLNYSEKEDVIVVDPLAATAKNDAGDRGTATGNQDETTSIHFSVVASEHHQEENVEATLDDVSQPMAAPTFPEDRNCFLGFSLVEIPSEASPTLALALVVDALFVDGPADRAGLALGDIVVAVNKRRLSSLTQIRDLLTAEAFVGCTLSIVVLRKKVAPAHADTQLWGGTPTNDEDDYDIVNCDLQTLSSHQRYLTLAPMLYYDPSTHERIARILAKTPEVFIA